MALETERYFSIRFFFWNVRLKVQLQSPLKFLNRHFQMEKHFYIQNKITTRCNLLAFGRFWFSLKHSERIFFPLSFQALSPHHPHTLPWTLLSSINLEPSSLFRPKFKLKQQFSTGLLAFLQVRCTSLCTTVFLQGKWLKRRKSPVSKPLLQRARSTKFRSYILQPSLKYLRDTQICSICSIFKTRCFNKKKISSI